jgi:alkylation response protein AidB-like acyl-CoA dehydrogenase
MSTPTQQELDEYRAEANAWFAQNTPKDPGFMLPLTFMEVGTEQQFNFLREWQNKVYEAGYIGAAWPKEYGGRGLDQKFQDIAAREMKKADTPIMLNAIRLRYGSRKEEILERYSVCRRYLVPRVF